MLVLRVDDVGRHPAAPAHGEPDGGFAWFAHWLDQVGLAERPLPAVYACIPGRQSPASLARLRGLVDPAASVAVHGATHAPGEFVSCDAMRQARSMFADAGLPVGSYVPPFNEYAAATIQAWADAGGVYFFGGIADEHHLLGRLPYRAQCWHLDACGRLYDRGRGLWEEGGLRAVAELGPLPIPYVVTLHATWHQSCLDRVRDVIDSLRPWAVGPSAVDAWHGLRASALAGEPGARRLPYARTLSQLSGGESLLDFGSRHSLWPALAALSGCRVSCFDRDPSMGPAQAANAARFRLPAPEVRVSDRLSELPVAAYDVVTAFWAVQHNMTWESQRDVLAALWRAVRPGGRLVFCGSLASGESFPQPHRADPQLVLSADDHNRLVRDLALPLVWDGTFRYQHGEHEARWEEPGQSNGLYWMAVKPEGAA